MKATLTNTTRERVVPLAIEALTDDIYVHPDTKEHYITLSGLSRMCAVTQQTIAGWYQNHRDLTKSHNRKARMLDGSLESVRVFSEHDIAAALSYFNVPKLINFSILGIRHHLQNLT